MGFDCDDGWGPPFLLARPKRKMGGHAYVLTSPDSLRTNTAMARLQGSPNGKEYGLTDRRSGSETAYIIITEGSGGGGGSGGRAAAASMYMAVSLQEDHAAARPRCDDDDGGLGSGGTGCETVAAAARVRGGLAAVLHDALRGAALPAALGSDTALLRSATVSRDAASGAYVLDFGDRVSRASVKNCLLHPWRAGESDGGAGFSTGVGSPGGGGPDPVPVAEARDAGNMRDGRDEGGALGAVAAAAAGPRADDDDAVLLMGKDGDHEFTLDFAFPCSATVALAAFLSRLRLSDAV
eukprot:365273-Chlamydomonas_euryale.AAC.17